MMLGMLHGTARAPTTQRRSMRAEEWRSRSSTTTLSSGRSGSGNSSRGAVENAGRRFAGRSAGEEGLDEEPDEEEVHQRPLIHRVKSGSRDSLFPSRLVVFSSSRERVSVCVCVCVCVDVSNCVGCVFLNDRNAFDQTRVREAMAT